MSRRRSYLVRIVLLKYVTSHALLPTFTENKQDDTDIARQSSQVRARFQFVRPEVKREKWVRDRLYGLQVSVSSSFWDAALGMLSVTLFCAEDGLCSRTEIHPSIHSLILFFSSDLSSDSSPPYVTMFIVSSIFLRDLDCWHPR